LKLAMQFHAHHSAQRAPFFRDQLRFITYTLKYPGAFGYTVLRMKEHYCPATIDAKKNNDGVVEIRTSNVAMLELSRGLGRIKLGHDTYDLEAAAGGSLPTVLFALRDGEWEGLEYVPSLWELRRNYAVKRPGLQGPIDDAFSGPFLCVRGTGEALSPALADWATWNLERFAHEWDKYFRGKLPAKNDTEVTDQDIQDCNLILFGDPGSNKWIREILDRLPVEWTPENFTLGGEVYATRSHAPVFVYPNPLNARRYVVINSGHTFHELELKGSNAQLYPRLGDVAVVQFVKDAGGGYQEIVAHAGMFNEQWKLPLPAAK